ncbi:NUDIX hydrolase [Williamsia sterculiae]|uniref:ADP-ribose pyrophosphatase YjhB, NUDIX family n=1 Tax=Williamsia sterculiae TaxID=1344003 RepID=A0A1N7FIU4_9NOCA|nr:NUDIX domain-containing protein [Williamsia sterculiae]SIS00231.1 ADP-ribose pyrophosphatase YjhB, NUDIX family [Williamsia sterculiae]
MAIPDFLAELRLYVGSERLWLTSAHAVVTSDDQRLALVRRADDGAWSIPGGIVEPGEHPADTVVRECREEIGIAVEPVSLVLVDVSPTFTYPNGDKAHYLDLVFRGRHRGGVLRVMDDESTEVGWFSPDTLPELDGYQRRQIDTALSGDVAAAFTLSRRDEAATSHPPPQP